MNNPYVPIDCEFHDILEAIATRALLVRVAFRRAGESVSVVASIVDIRTRADAEYLVLSSGDSVRLDHLMNVDIDRVRA